MRRRNVNTTEATDRQVEALKAQGFGDFTAIVRAAIDRMYREETGGKAMGEHDGGMDRRTFLDWYSGGEAVDPMTEAKAREFITDLSAENGTMVSEADMDRYIEWLANGGLVVD
jgi:hypothetical protein